MAGFGLSRALFRLALPRWVKAGMRSTQMVNLGKAMGWSFRRKTMFADVRQYTGWAKHEFAVRAAPRAKPLSKFIMTPVEWSKPFAYRIKAECTYVDLDTGEEFTKVVTMYDDFNRGPDGWMQKYKESQVWQEYGRDFEVVGMEFFTGDYDPRRI